MTVYSCCDQNRRRLVLASATLNGIDWIDVVDLEAATPALRQRQLRVSFVRTPAPAGITPANVVITGGERITGIQCDTVSYDGAVLVVHLTAYGDSSPYTLSLVGPDGSPLPGLDPVLYQISFSFKVECPADIDCAAVAACPVPSLPPPQIDYLAKDYPTLRTLMLDRMALTAPGWTERNPADAGIALVEVLAYAADHLSYQQDAIATEAYLHTARRRVSLRRHAKLVDYAISDGCNARVWVALTVAAAADGHTLPGPHAPLPGTLLMTRVQDATLVTAAERNAALSALPTCFETMQDLVLFSSLNQLDFYTWGDGRCCLPAGSTTATLVAPSGTLPDLRGRVLIFQEMMGPDTGVPADADATHRQAIRVVTMNPVPGAPARTDPLTGTAIVDITWAAQDALTFPVCVSSITDAAHGSRTLPAVSLAWGNVALADHGLTQPVEDLGSMPAPTLYAVATAGGDRCNPAAPQAIPARFTPTLANAPLTQVGQVEQIVTFEGEQEATLIPFDPTAPAAAAMQWDSGNCLPAIHLTGTTPSGSTVWTARQDLLESHETDTDFVVEIDSDLIARLRFGDDEYALRPPASTDFTAIYRVGNGVAGNVGAGSIVHVAAPVSGALPPGIVTVTNPLPAEGGVDPESEDSVRMAAPQAFRVQERAVTAADWQNVSLRNPAVAQATADFRWTGSWLTVFDTVARPGGVAVDANFESTIASYLERYRVIGHDLQVNGPVLVPLRIDLAVCVRPPWFRADVTRALRSIFGTGALADGTPAFFSPAQASFGETLYLSRIYAAAQAVPGVDSLQVTRFERLYQPAGDGLANWELVFGPQEMPRCDNDPNYPEHGVLNLTVVGGQ